MNDDQQALRMTMSARYLKAQLDILAKLGFSHAQSFDVLKIDPKILSDPMCRIDVDDILPLLAAAEKDLNDPCIGLKMGYQFRPGSFAQTGAVYSHCKDLLQVIEINHRYQRLAIDVGRARHETMKTASDGKKNYMVFETYYDDHDRYRHITDMVMGAYGTTYRWLSWGGGEKFMNVQFPYSKPMDSSFHETVFRCGLDFNCEKAAIELSESMLSETLSTYDPEKLAIAISWLDEALGAITAEISFKKAVQSAMRSALELGQISAAIVAKRLDMPERKLLSKMKKCGASYRKVLDNVRKNVFLEQYRQGQNFAAIAQNLAYNDQAAFNRAFRRWYDMSPGQWEKTAQHELVEA
ncbi:AraC family transcriptional regulator ligand-binding domain-containing protein [Hellea sp.]|nr:AraC family transcriptional regulator ligand-binding domain-containing protein [Hellea sp.]